MNLSRRLFVLLVLALVPAAFAQPPWTLTTADFQARPADLKSINPAGITLSDNARLTWDQFLQISRDSLPKTSAAPFILHTTTGDHLHGAPIKTDSEKLHWKVPSLGDIAIPMTQIQSITRGAHSTPTQTKVTEDLVTLANGDKVKGIISDIASDKVTVQSNGNTIPVPLDSIDTISLASTGETSKPAGRAFRIRLADGSSLLAAQLQLTNDELSITLADNSTRHVDLANLASLEQVNGPVAFLSGLDPIENVNVPYLDRVHPAQTDRTVNGEPIRFGDKTFARGIGVYPYSKITWKLDGSYAGFRTRYAIAGDGPYANVTVRIRLDDKVAYEQANVTAGNLSPVIALPLNSAKSLTLEVDYGKNFSVQDRFNWIEPALTKSPPPATQP